jgi:hypothetical protein
VCRLKIISNRVKTTSHDRFHYFGHCQDLGQHINLDLALCCSLDHGLHKALGHSLNLALYLCHGLGLFHDLHHGHRIGLGHALGLSMSRSCYV